MRVADMLPITRELLEDARLELWAWIELENRRNQVAAIMGEKRVDAVEALERGTDRWDVVHFVEYECSESVVTFG